MTLVRQRFPKYDSKNMNQKKEKKPKNKKYDQEGEKKPPQVGLGEIENFCSLSPFLQEISPSKPELIFQLEREERLMMETQRDGCSGWRTIWQSPSSQRAPPKTRVRRGQALRCLYPHCSNFSYPSSLFCPSCTARFAAHQTCLSDVFCSLGHLACFAVCALNEGAG